MPLRPEVRSSSVFWCGLVALLALGCERDEIALAYENCEVLDPFDPELECEGDLSCWGIPTEDTELIFSGLRHCTVGFCLDDSFCPPDGVCIDLGSNGFYQCFQRCEGSSDCAHSFLQCREPRNAPGVSVCVSSR